MDRVIRLIAVAFLLGTLSGCGKFDPAKSLYKLRLDEISKLGSGQGKVFNNNPVVAANSTVGYSEYELVFGGVKDYDQYFTEVTITGTTNGYLENSDFAVYPDLDGTHERARPGLFGHWNFSTRKDSDDFVGQLMAFYYVTQQKQTIQSASPDAWHLANKQVPIFTKCLEMQNAFWAGAERVMCLGYFRNQHLSYDASILLHEMGHGNLDFATSSPQGVATIYTGSYQNCTISNGGGQPLFDSETNQVATFKCCTSTSGCMAAINEGQADYHAFSVLNRGSLGEFLVNSLSGMDHRNANVHTGANPLDLTEMFLGDPLIGDSVPGFILPANIISFNRQFGPEVHNLGAVWAAVWWNLQKSSNLGKEKTDKIFFSHLHLLDAQDTFRTALDSVLYGMIALRTSGDEGFTDLNTFRSDWDMVKDIFADHGITPTASAPAKP